MTGNGRAEFWEGSFVVREASVEPVRASTSRGPISLERPVDQSLEKRLIRPGDSGLERNVLDKNNDLFGQITSRLAFVHDLGQAPTQRHQVRVIRSQPLLGER
jgi:hypothetical protein